MISAQFHEHADLTACFAEGATIEYSETSADGRLVYDYDATGWLVQVTVRLPSSAKVVPRRVHDEEAEAGTPEAGA